MHYMIKVKFFVVVKYIYNGKIMMQTCLKSRRIKRDLCYYLGYLKVSQDLKADVRINIC